MSKEELKKVGTEVQEETLISLKILALKKRVTLAEYVREVLDKHVQSKSKQIEES
ncbi:MAG TPA: hypothetical protein VK553_12140 [Candidatus Nitrosopolaris rasttigaisensis]|nr:hypothetical protein [Candidatus Nitrosopolaris rasttigaisensis]